VYIANNLHNYWKLTGNINTVFTPQKPLNKTRIKSRNTPALPALLRGSETWTTEAKDARRITAAEIKYLRITAACSWTDHKTNAEVTVITTESDTPQKEKHKILIRNANVQFSTECLQFNLTPNYANIKVNNTSPGSKFTQRTVVCQTAFILTVIEVTHRDDPS
jgi:hypothetical protein